MSYKKIIQIIPCTFPMFACYYLKETNEIMRKKIPIIAIVSDAEEMDKPHSCEGAVWPKDYPNSDGTDQLCIGTLEGVYVVSWSDWIIRGIKGELYACKPDIFEATYEEVSDG